MPDSPDTDADEEPEEEELSLVEVFFDAQQAIFDHVGYEPDWRVLPLDDQTDSYWAVDRAEQEWCRWSPKQDALAHWIQMDEYREEDGNHVYEATIYTNRHLPRWVYRGEEFSLVCVDTQADGNQLLMIFRTDHEVRAV